MRRIPNPKRIRLSLNLSQEAFSRQFQIHVRTPRDWEQNVRMPDSTAMAYLHVIA
jgi:DNA-binding transcriptional regulator YiaG